MSPAQARAAREHLSALRVGVPAGLKLLVPYNFDRALLEVLAPVAPQLDALYLPLPPSVSLSARAYNGPSGTSAYEDELDFVAARAGALGLGLSFVANAGLLRVDTDALLAIVARVRGRVPRVRVTFTDIRAAIAARQGDPELDISPSCLANVDSQMRARWWVEETGARHIVIARDINRRPAVQAAIRDLGVTLGVVDCDECVPGCIWQQRHFESAGCDGEIDSSCAPHALAVRHGRPWVLAQKEILPGHLHRLVPLVSELKVVGRDKTTSELLRRLVRVLEARSLVHPHGLYQEPPEAWDEIASCDRWCSRCGWCENHIVPVPSEPDESENVSRPSDDSPPEAVQAAIRIGERLAAEPAEPLRGYEMVDARQERSREGAPELKLVLRRGDDTLTVYVRERRDAERPLLETRRFALLFGDGASPRDETTWQVARHLLAALDEGLPDRSF